MDKIREEEILEVIKNNPDVIKGIIANEKNTNHSNTRKLSKDIEGLLRSEFKLDTYATNRVKGHMSGMMRMALLIAKAKDIPEAKYKLAEQFYTELLDLVRKYRILSKQEVQHETRRED